MNDIEKIITAASFAPSGENCQPWRFSVQNEEISLYNVPERDYSLYSWGQRASCIANGAALENMLIAAKHFGYAGNVKILPDQSQHNLIAKISLVKTNATKDSLFDFIESRCSNRKPYKKISVTDTQKALILEAGNSFPEARVVLADDAATISHLAEVASVNEKILFENFYLHEFFFNHINWTLEQELKNKIGFYTKTLELPPPALFMFKLCKSWKRQKILNKIGISKLIGKANEQVYKSAPIMGVVVIPSDSAEHFVCAGRALERLWLTVAKLNLSLQPMTGVLFLMLKIKNNDAEKLSPEHQKLVKYAYGEIARSFKQENGQIAMFFRIGVGGSPSAHATRLPPEINWLN